MHGYAAPCFAYQHGCVRSCHRPEPAHGRGMRARRCQYANNTASENRLLLPMQRKTLHLQSKKRFALHSCMFPARSVFVANGSQQRTRHVFITMLWGWCRCLEGHGCSAASSTLSPPALLAHERYSSKIFKRGSRTSLVFFFFGCCSSWRRQKTTIIVKCKIRLSLY